MKWSAAAERRVEEYLRAVERHLAHKPACVRRNVVAGLRNQISESLRRLETAGGEIGLEIVERVLSDMDPPETFAETAAEAAAEAAVALAPKMARSGAYWLEVGGEKANGDGRLIVVTDLGLAARTFPGGALVWVNSLRTAEPAAGAEVTVYARNNQVLARGTAGERGLANLEWAEGEGSEPFVVVAELDGDLSYFDLARTGVDQGEGLGGAAELSLAEAALLAGLPQSPSRLRPDRHPGPAKRRQAYVLERMEACGFITAQERAEALAQPPEARPGKYPFRAPHFCDLAGVSARAAKDSTVRTTLDADLQRMAEDILRRQLEGGLAEGGAVVVLEVKTGAVRALVGSPDYYAERRAGQVNGAMAPRAAGSTLKPFAYALAIDRGLATPATVIPDVPTRFRDLDPRNFSQDFRWLVSVRDALVLSLNLPAIEIERRVGQERFYAVLRDLGLATIDQPAEHYGLGLALGNATVRLLDLANAYACFARGGNWAPARFVESGKPPATKPFFSPEAC